MARGSLGTPTPAPTPSIAPTAIFSMHNPLCPRFGGGCSFFFTNPTDILKIFYGFVNPVGYPWHSPLQIPPRKYLTTPKKSYIIIYYVFLWYEGEPYERQNPRLAEI